MHEARPGNLKFFNPKLEGIAWKWRKCRFISRRRDRINSFLSWQRVVSRGQRAGRLDRDFLPGHRSFTERERNTYGESKSKDGVEEGGGCRESILRILSRILQSRAAELNEVRPREFPWRGIIGAPTKGGGGRGRKRKGEEEVLRSIKEKNASSSLDPLPNRSATRFLNFSASE